MNFPKSCDTFVVLSNHNKDRRVIFGKNSDRPQNEVQEVVFIKGGLRDKKLKCTYITIEESANPVNDVILSKPAWMWGAEMGANDKNVVIGNEAVWTNNNDGDGDAKEKRLLGMDLLRLGLERGNTAEDALCVITTLLEIYGQGGPCSEHDDYHYYHNSYIIADPTEAWVLETSGKLWVAEKLESGYRNISNGLTITTKIDKHSEKLHEIAKSMKLWDGETKFNFTECFSSGGDDIRQEEGEILLKNSTAGMSFDVKDMFYILRHKESFICRGCDDSYPTQGSQVSSLSANSINIHWFTGTPDPSQSLFKPFIFTPNPQVSPYTKSPNEPLREHYLYSLHAARVIKSDNETIIKILQDTENGYIDKIEDYIRTLDSGHSTLHELDCIMKECVETEVKLYGG
ncbi:secernin-3 isoform X1 [Achroia grisella]|uniref:secernin-3 isoform X1 n=1 Tax=Achroia grisella TaxID=688607 RepID=UPI0027D33AF8|nr:secernin-3 isoform X1 [Achroia grisella]